MEALCGTVVDAGEGCDPADLLIGAGLEFEAVGGGSWLAGVNGVWADDPPALVARAVGVPLTIHRRPTRRSWTTDPKEAREFLQLVDATLDRFRPDVLLTCGGDPVTQEVLARARGRGVATVFALHNFSYNDRSPFNDVDAVIVPSRLAADHYHAALELDCVVLPNLVDVERVRVEQAEPRYVTFVTPSPEKGVDPFVRIADELGRRRPDIPLLVVESRGTEGTLVARGLDLRTRGNVFLMARTADPRAFWGVTRLCLLPSLWWENQPLTAIEAMTNGIPVIGSIGAASPRRWEAPGSACHCPSG